eukprot:6457032-Prymnesium_polylepis.1
MSYRAIVDFNRECAETCYTYWERHPEAPSLVPAVVRSALAPASWRSRPRRRARTATGGGALRPHR